MQSYYDSVSNTTGYVLAVNQNLHTILAPTEIISTGTIANITASANNQLLTVFYETVNTYGYDTVTQSNFITSVTVTQGGTVGSPALVVRSVGLSSKSFIINNIIYFMSVYDSPYQPTYFLHNSIGQVISKLAYSNGGGFNILGLQAPTILGNEVAIPYLIKRILVQSINKTQGASNSAGIYTQTGINIATFNFTPPTITTAEIGSNLHLTGGFLWMYDGYIPVEHNFFLWPDNVKGTPNNTGGSMASQQYYYQAIYQWTDNQGNIHNSAPSIPLLVDMSSDNAAFTPPTPLTPTAYFNSGSNDITVSSTTGLAIGQVVGDSTNPTYIQATSYITNIVGSVVTLSLPVTNTVTSGSPDTLAISTINSATIYVPTLRLTYKTANPVKIVIYRWSTGATKLFSKSQLSINLF